MLKNDIQKTAHINCLLCGDCDKNPWSQGITFYQEEDGWLYGSFQAHDKLQGYDGILHGGVTTALLDAAMTHCLFHQGVEAVTAEIKVRFLKPIPCDSNILLMARLLSNKSSLYSLEAKLFCEKQPMAIATAKFMHKIY